MVYTQPAKDNVRNLSPFPTRLNLDMATTPALHIIMVHISCSIFFAEGKNGNRISEININFHGFLPEAASFQQHHKLCC